jgi:ABC-2 type transport system ATP-binding protein
VDLVERRGCTIALATHNAEEAFDFCDRVAVLHKGRILASGRAADLVARLEGAGDRYRVVTSHPDHAVWASLEWRGLVKRIGRAVALDERWTAIECAIEGGPSRASVALRGLVDGGLEIARFERVEPSLADLITRIIGAESVGTATGHA